MTAAISPNSLSILADQLLYFEGDTLLAMKRASRYSDRGRRSSTMSTMAVQTCRSVIVGPLFVQPQQLRKGAYGAFPRAEFDNIYGPFCSCKRTSTWGSCPGREKGPSSGRSRDLRVAVRMGGQESDFDKALAIPGVDGVGVHLTWSTISPAVKRYDFTAMDRQLAVARSRHLAVGSRSRRAMAFRIGCSCRLRPV